MKNARTAAAVVTCSAALLAGCGSGSGSPSATVTVTQTVAPTFAWPTEATSTGQSGEAPDFPTSLDGWRPGKTWSFTVRAFEGEWSDGTWGNNWSKWQATMNGCNEEIVLLRWRALANDASVTAGWTADAQHTSQVPSGSKGWLVVDQCSTPRWQLAADFANGANLVDVTVDAQVWDPAP